MFLHELGLDILFGLLDKVVVVNLGDISLTWITNGTFRSTSLLTSLSYGLINHWLKFLKALTLAQQKFLRYSSPAFKAGCCDDGFIGFSCFLKGNV